MDWKEILKYKHIKLSMSYELVQTRFEWASSNGSITLQYIPYGTEYEKGDHFTVKLIYSTVKV